MSNEPDGGTDPLAHIHEPTRLLTCDALARAHGVRRVLLKLEAERPLGNFKVLGGAVAGLNALRCAASRPGSQAGSPVPRLLCASDGNHGLAVAAAARSAGAAATIFLHEDVDPVRARRIEALGASIVRVPGTYDDAVEAAAAAAARGDGLLIPDTSSDPSDPVTLEVMAGYGILFRETVAQLKRSGAPDLTHAFVQCGVGGLAAAAAEGLRPVLGEEGLIALVEPERAACVGHALRTGRVERISGDLRTSAEMLSCGLASAPAIAVLSRHRVMDLTVEEPAIAEGVAELAALAGIDTTASGGAGYAGLRRVSHDPALRRRFKLDERSSVLLLITEAGFGGADEVA